MDTEVKLHYSLVSVSKRGSSLGRARVLHAEGWLPRALKDTKVVATPSWRCPYTNPDMMYANKCKLQLPVSIQKPG